MEAEMRDTPLTQSEHGDDVRLRGGGGLRQAQDQAAVEQPPRSEAPDTRGRRGGFNGGRQGGVKGGRRGSRGLGRGGTSSNLPRFDLNETARGLDLNIEPPSDDDGAEIPRVGNNSEATADDAHGIRGPGRGQGQGALEGGQDSAVVTKSKRGTGRARGRPRGPGRGRGSVRRASTVPESGSDEPSCDQATPPGWIPPGIEPNTRSPHCLRSQQARRRISPRGNPVVIPNLINPAREATTETLPFSPNSMLGHHRQRRRINDSRAEGGDPISHAARGLESAFAASEHVQRWLQEDQHEGEPESRGSDPYLPRLDGPFGTVSMRPLPPAVWVSLPLLGYDPVHWGGLQEFVGKPQQRWQEHGVPYYFIMFKGSIGGRKVRVADCRVLEGVTTCACADNVAGPSTCHGEGSDNDDIPEFPTQRLDEELTSPIHCQWRTDVADIATCTIPGPPSNASDDSSESEWRADWHDFAGDASSIEYSDSECTSGGSVDLRHEIGYYEDNGDLDDLEFRDRYHDRFWQSQETTLLGDRESFRGPQPGPTSRVPRRRCPSLHFFNLFFDNRVVQEVVDQTNLYASQQGTGRSKYTNGGPHWVPTCPLEIRAFVGVTILMGIKLMPTIRDYWKKNEFLQCSLIPRVFTRNRFESLLQCLHLVNNETIESDRESPEYDKLAKVRWIISDFVTKSQMFFNPEKFITCDEIMVAYRGHYSGFRQYMLAKPTKYGFKFFASVCNPSRYIYNLLPYVGASSVPDVRQGERVVRELIVGLDGVGHTIVCDNFFSSPKLFEDLLKRGIWATGTIRENRIGLPTSLLGHKKGEHPRGTLMWRMHAQRRMAATCWYDSKPVYILSTSADSIGEGAHSMRWVNGERQSIASTPQQVEYQTHMRGVDVVDQMRTDYSVQFHSHKWWHKHLFFIVDCWLQNSWVLLKHDRLTRGEKVYRKRLSYHIEIAESLIAPWLDPPSTCKASCFRHPTALHYSSIRPNLWRRCIVCKRKTRFRCTTCAGNHMCVDKCFVKVHSE